MSAIAAVISDFGGVLTSPLLDAFKGSSESSGVSAEALGNALGAIWKREDAHPLFELETGRITEAAFLTLLGEELTAQLGRPVEMDGFNDRLFEHLKPNHTMIEFMRQLRGRGYKLAICTNNIREWEARWRAMLPIDEIFDAVVDSAFVGTRKPEPEIYELTLARLEVPAAAALFVDDVELNCEAARTLGIRSVWFRDTGQAIADIEATLAEL